MKISNSVCAHAGRPAENISSRFNAASILSVGSGYIMREIIGPFRDAGLIANFVLLVLLLPITVLHATNADAADSSNEHFDGKTTQ